MYDDVLSLVCPFLGKQPVGYQLKSEYSHRILLKNEPKPNSRQYVADKKTGERPHSKMNQIESRDNI